ncbi:MAG: PAS domain-containing protein [Polyangiaceae bacterium]
MNPPRKLSTNPNPSTSPRGGLPRLVELEAIRAAVGEAQAVIEFMPDGTILDANENFLAAVGYELDEIVGEHHRMFMAPSDARTIQYKQFWKSLASGEPKSGEFKRVTKAGEELWLQASYNPIADESGKVHKVIKFATDVTALKRQTAEFESQIMAIGKSQAVIEFKLDGTIVHANGAFLDALGYTMDEIRGKHHRTFVSPEEAASPAYREFWDKLRRGEYDAGRYRRIGKGGKEVWIQASYNPILDMSGHPTKVIKYATDITESVLAQKRQDAGVEAILDAVVAAKNGDLTRELQISGDDAVGRIARSLQDLFQGFRSNITTIAESASSVGAAAEELSSTSRELSKNAKTTQDRTEATRTSASQVDQNIQLVATAAEEMSASIKEIAKNASGASQVASSAVTTAEQTRDIINTLGTSSAEIGKVVKVINGVAQQTNLLALNATIEAARAGEAGKGFAVVANEVKELAKETASASEDIAQKVETIQKDTEQAVEAIGQIFSIIQKINDMQNTIAAAVEEQTATTAEISRNVLEAARESAEIGSNLGSVSEVATETSQGAANTTEASQELSRLAQVLQGLVDGFKV